MIWSYWLLSLNFGEHGRRSHAFFLDGVLHAFLSDELDSARMDLVILAIIVGLRRAWKELTRVSLDGALHAFLLDELDSARIDRIVMAIILELQPG